MSKYATFLDDLTPQPSPPQTQTNPPQRFSSPYSENGNTLDKYKLQQNNTYVSMGYNDTRSQHIDMMETKNFYTENMKQTSTPYDSFASMNLKNQKLEKPAQYIPGQKEERNDIRKILTDYFDNPVVKFMKKEDGMYIYGAKIGFPLLSGYRYLFISFPESIVNKSANLKEELFMDFIPFTHLQTREIKDVYNLPVTNYQAKNTSRYIIPIQQTEENDMMTIYKSMNNDFQVILLQGKIKKPYQFNGNLVKALETYNTIVKIL